MKFYSNTDRIDISFDNDDDEAIFQTLEIITQKIKIK